MRRQIQSWLFFGLLLTLPQLSLAVDYELPADIGSGAFASCSTTPTVLVYECTANVEINGDDSVLLTCAPAPCNAGVTLIVAGEFRVNQFGSVNNNGFSFNVEATTIDIEGTGAVVMDNLTADGDIKVLNEAELTGNLTSTNGNIEIGELAADKDKDKDGINDSGTNTVTGNINAENGNVNIAGGNNFVDGNITADDGNGTIDIDATSTVSGVCNPDHPQCEGDPGPPGPGECTTEEIATDGEEFRGISGSSDSNIIAAGKDGSLYHYDGSSWTRHAFVSGEDLRDVEVVAANLAYAVGKKGTVLEYDGTDWITLPAPTNEELMGVWAISSSEVWVVGKKNALYRWNGTSWQDMSGAGQANVDNGEELRDAWGDANTFYALEKDGDLYRYSRTTGPWSKRTACNAGFNMDVRDLWGDGTGNVYIAGKDKGPNPDEAAIFLYNEGSDSCSKLFATTTENNLEGVSGNGTTVFAVGKAGLVVENSSGSFSESIDGSEDYKDVWVSPSSTPYYAGKNGMITTCTPLVGVLDHFVISPATFAASTCLANAITITAKDSDDNTLLDYTGTVTITTTNTTNAGIHRGNWSKTVTANGVLNPDPDNDDNGNVEYTFDATDLGVVTLNLNNIHAETLTVTVSEGGVFTPSADISFGDNVFVITEDPVQVAGRPLAMKIEMYTNDGSNCFVDTNYNYSHNLSVSIDRNGVLTGANAPTIGIAIPDLPMSTLINFDFASAPGEANFILDNDDVGQYRLVVTDNTLAHSDLAIVGISEIMTLAPFGIGIDFLRDTLRDPPGATTNPGNATSADPIFTTAGNNLSATVSGVLWDTADDLLGNDGVLDTGVYDDNPPAPSFAWDTELSVSLLAASYTPSPGTPGSLNNNIVAAGTYSGGSALISALQYTEVGSFTLLALVEDYLGVPGLNIGGDDIIVGRFIPASFDVGIIDNGILDDACGVFTYVGQNFSYDTAPRITVTAMNSLGVRTAQYRDAFVKLDASSLTVQAIRDETTVGTDTVLLDVSYNAAATTFTAQNNGIVNYTFGADTYRYGPDAPVNFSKNDNSQVPQFTADIDPVITEITDIEVTSIPPGGTNVLNPLGNNLLFGRLRMENAHGSEISPLVMPVITEYWNGFSFQQNSLDTCTIIAPGDLISTASPVGLSVPGVVNTPAAAGDVNYSYPAPGDGIDGFIDTTTNLSTAAHLWLRYDWIVDGVFDDDPSARATFGIYEGDPVQIYLQQIYE